MRKYWEISKIYMKTQLAWRADIVFNMLFTIMKILFAILLWGMVFKDRDMAGVFSFNAMISYYVISSFLSQLEMSGGVSSEIYERIRNGTFSKYMVIPAGIERYFLAMESGIVLFYILFDFIAAFICIFIFQVKFIFISSPKIVICAIIMFMLGLVFMVQLNYLLGIMSLKYPGIQTFLMIKDNICMLITGGIVPLILFPETVVDIFKAFPFYYVTYLPAMLLSGFCQEEAVSGIFIILFWCVVVQFAINIFWKKYIKKYEGVGI